MSGVAEYLRFFFETGALNPHGICLLWRPELIWTHAGADTLLGAAYLSVALSLAAFLYHRNDFRFSWAGWLVVTAFGTCGLTHFMGVWTLWQPYYGAEALLKVVTAASSVVTALMLWPVLPKAIAMPSSKQLQASLAERDDALGELRAAMATMVEMREHEDRQKLLLDELNHRVKNTLAAVQSIAAQTLNDTHSMPEARELLVERLMALSATHNILVKSEWDGALLHELIDTTLSPYGRLWTRAGPDIRLEANLAVSLGMALHELATNALKHGAWCSAVGQVEIEIAAEDGANVRIAWRERGGMRVQAPARRGFGSRLLERGIAGDTGGSVHLDFAPEGLVCTIVAPLSKRLQLTA